MRREKGMEELDTLSAHVEDLGDRAEKGVLCSTSFLSLREQAQLSRSFPGLLASRGVFDGGFAGAERKKLYLLPDYLTAMLDSPVGKLPREALLPVLGEEWQADIAVLRVDGSGYRKLDHRDFMGALLGMGIERQVVGDIVVIDDDTAYVVCERKIAAYLLNEWKTVGSDTVKVAAVELPADFCPERRFLAIHDTVASGRLDCIVAALTNLSREKAQNLIRSGMVEVDHLPEERVDREVPAGAVLSLRGFGRFDVLGMEGQTKKGRFRLSARKYL